MSDQAGSSSASELTNEQQAENDKPEEKDQAEFVNGEECVTIGDILREQEEEEEEALAVLGGSDEKNCTYSKGYIKRQALYACLTCCPESKEDPSKRAGVCLACSLACHNNHELIELYTKRHFRCDCGAANMKSVQCTLEPIKFGLNEENSYNQNFSGVYCTCHRPYPDPEDNIGDEMGQCCVCEDWFHSRHLNADIPKANFTEMVCGSCMDSLPFLACYLDHSYKGGESEAEVEPPPKKQKLENSECTKPPQMDRQSGSAVFWAPDWRQQLCRCDACLKVYQEKKVEFLLDLEDTVQKYEEIGKNREKGPDPLDEALSSLNHVQQIDVITKYNKFKSRLGEFLNTFAANNQVITSEDVTRFFDMMKKEKKPAPGMPFFCR